MKKLKFFSVVVVLFMVFSCAEDELLAPMLNDSETAVLRCPPPPAPICAEVVVDLMAGQHHVIGSITVSHDDANVYVEYRTSDGWYMAETHLYAGDCGAIPVTKKGNPIPGKFPYITVHDPWVQAFTYTIPMDGFGIGDEICIAAHAATYRMVDGIVIQEETGWGRGEPFPGSSWGMFFRYLIEECTPPPPVCEEQLRTQTQGGWGSPPNSGPGQYLDAHFAAAFPSGVEVGCASGFSASFTNADAVRNFLPAGGTAAALTQDYVNPATNDLKNVFAGQVLALRLNVGFDYHDPDFGPSGYNLGEMIIAYGPFSGWTVDALLSEAMDAIGGCSNTYDISGLNDAVSSVNENYVDGTRIGIFLTCP